MVKLVLLKLLVKIISRTRYKVHDGDTTEHPILLARSGSVKPGAIRSTGHQMLIRFVTDNKVPSRGFQANYYSVLKKI